MYDFLTWISPPSSLKLITEEPRYSAFLVAEEVAVTPGAPTRLEVYAKQDKIVHDTSFVLLERIIEGRWRWYQTIYFPKEPKDRFDWQKFSLDFINHVECDKVRISLHGGGVNWFDDLKIFQNDVLIYENDFSNWAPIIIPAQIITGVAMIKYLK